MTSPQTTAPYLIVPTAGSNTDRRLPITKDRTVVGRAPTCDVRLNNPQVSRTHAILTRRGNSVYVEDLGSSGGTSVNGVGITGPCELHSGDRVALAGVQLQYEDPISPTTSIAPSVSYDVGQQHAHSISNVGRDQYNSYAQHINQQRESFFREIARTRTKARLLVWTGLALFVIGFALFAAGVARFLTLLPGLDANSDPSSATPFGVDIAGIPSGLLGWAIAVVGILLIVVGIVLHVVATSRRKRVDRDLPAPAPRPGR
jgi:pSer/pThr/pTyr-binding forkhead associated (FHA) protein/uncharacterized membrane protein